MLIREIKFPIFVLKKIFMFQDSIAIMNRIKIMMMGIYLPF